MIRHVKFGYLISMMSSCFACGPLQVNFPENVLKLGCRINLEVFKELDWITRQWRWNTFNVQLSIQSVLKMVCCWTSDYSLVSGILFFVFLWLSTFGIDALHCLEDIIEAFTVKCIWEWKGWNLLYNFRVGWLEMLCYVILKICQFCVRLI